MCSPHIHPNYTDWKQQIKKVKNILTLFEVTGHSFLEFILIEV